MKKKGFNSSLPPSNLICRGDRKIRPPVYMYLVVGTGLGQRAGRIVIIYQSLHNAVIFCSKEPYLPHKSKNSSIIYLWYVFPDIEMEWKTSHSNIIEPPAHFGYYYM